MWDRNCHINPLHIAGYCCATYWLFVYLQFTNHSVKADKLSTTCFMDGFLVTSHSPLSACLHGCTSKHLLAQVVISHSVAKLSLQTAPSDLWIKIRTHQCTPSGLQPLGEFCETLPKSACWAGDYNAVPPAESQEPAKSCLGLHPPPYFFLLFSHTSFLGLSFPLNHLFL